VQANHRDIVNLMRLERLFAQATTKGAIPDTSHLRRESEIIVPKIAPSRLRERITKPQHCETAALFASLFSHYNAAFFDIIS
jgi:hypothetical protein